MLDTKKFGQYLSKLRKDADLTQSELADRLDLSLQQLSRYELGESFPDVSLLVNISDSFGITIDELIASCDPTRGEKEILSAVSQGKDVVPDSFDDIVGVAPYLKPSVLRRLSESLMNKGIDISHIVALAEYLSEESVLEMIQRADIGAFDEKMLEKLMPVLDEKSKNRMLEMILDGEMDWHMIRVMMPYVEYMYQHIEAAVVEGALPWEVLEIMREARLKQSREE